MRGLTIRVRTILKSVVAGAKVVIADFKRDDVPGLAAEIAYHATFAIPPMIILVVTIAAAINQFTGYEIADKLITAIDVHAPDEIRELLTTLVETAIINAGHGVTSLGVIVAAAIAIWSGSNGVGALIKAFNRAYGVVEDRSWLRLKSTAIGLTLLFAVLINAAFFMLVFGQQIVDWLVSRLDLSSEFSRTLDLLLGPLAIVSVMFVLALLYHVGPNVVHEFRFFTRGSLIATGIWILLVFGFRIYLQFINPGSAYGALGSIVVLLFFLYLSGIVFVLGAEINAMYRLGAETTLEAVQEPSETRLTDVESDRLPQTPESAQRYRNGH